MMCIARDFAIVTVACVIGIIAVLVFAPAGF